jgi:hypothetical protein
MKIISSTVLIDYIKAKKIIWLWFGNFVDVRDVAGYYFTF